MVHLVVDKYKRKKKTKPTLILKDYERKEMKKAILKELNKWSTNKNWKRMSEDRTCIDEGNKGRDDNKTV